MFQKNLLPSLRIRPETCPKFLLKLGPNRNPNRTRKARSDLQFCGATFRGNPGEGFNSLTSFSMYEIKSIKICWI